MVEARKGLERVSQESRRKPRTNERAAKIEPAIEDVKEIKNDKDVKQSEQSGRDNDVPKAAQVRKSETIIDKKTSKTENKKSAKIDNKKIDNKKSARADNVDKKTAQASKNADKNSRNIHDRKTAESKKPDSRTKQREKEARAHNKRQKAERSSDKHRKYVRDETPRYHRAGAPEVRRRDTRFTDIWTDNPRR
jgi:hypothetical protein